MKTFNVVLFFLIFINLHAKNIAHTQKDSALNSQELAYLQKKEFLTACVNPQWMPFSAIKDGKYVGIDADYMKVFERKLGIPIRVYRTKSWNQSLGFAKGRKCDLVNMLAKTKEREEFLSFTQAYFDFSNVLVTNVNKRILTDIEFLENEEIAIMYGSQEIKTLKNEYPNLKLLQVSSLQEGLQKVKNNEVYGFIDNAYSIDYYFQTHDYTEYKIGVYFHKKSYLHLGVPKHEKTLHTILEKVIQSIPLHEQQNIKSKWLRLQKDQEVDDSLFYNIMAIMFILVLFVAYRQYSVQALNKELNRRVTQELKNSQEKDKMIFHQSKLIAMGEMMENIAHQWRQPLSQVNSCVLVIDDVLDEQGVNDAVVEKKLHEIESLTKYMSNTIDDFKNFFDQNKEKTNLVVEDIVKRSLKILKTKINTNDIKVIVDLRLAHESFTHENELQQVFLTILNNAVDVLALNKVDKPNIKIEIKRKKDYNFISICDNAGGISEEILEKIFEPYYTTKHKAQGTGLGLYIAKIIIEDSLEGQLSVKNTFAGACFTIQLKSSIG